MKLFTTVAASVVAVLLGARLTFAAFAPVLPPDFHRASDLGYEQSHSWAEWTIRSAAEFYNATGAWPTDIYELHAGPRYAEWKTSEPSPRSRQERDERRWKSWADQFVDRIRILDSDSEFEAVVAVFWDEMSSTAACTVNVNQEYAARYGRLNPIGPLPDQLDPWPLMECRRIVGLRAAVPWTGLDVHRERPAERYSRMTYAEQAWVRDTLFNRASPEVP